MVNQRVQCYSALKRNALSSHEKTWRKRNVYYWVKEANLKRLYNVWFQFYDTLEEEKPRKQLKKKKKSQWLPGAGGEEGIGRQCTEDFSGLCNYCVWYRNGRYMIYLLYMCPDPQNAKHHGWNLMQTMQFGWWHVKVGLPVVTNVSPLAQSVDTGGGQVREEAESMVGILRTTCSVVLGT